MPVCKVEAKVGREALEVIPDVAWPVSLVVTVGGIVWLASSEDTGESANSVVVARIVLSVVVSVPNSELV